MARPRPREAVLTMRPYSPPTGGRAGKMRLDFNENTGEASPKVAAALRALGTGVLPIYPEYAAVRDTLAGYFGFGVDEFTLTNGTDEAIQILINAYVDDGDQVVILRPSYAMYRFYSELAGAEVTEIGYRPDDLAFPMEQLLDAITPATQAVLVSNPNNPTGTGIGIDQIERIVAKAAHAAVLIDEAYYEFSGVTAFPLVDRYPNLFVSRTFSKVYGLAGLRMGCLFSQKENVALLRKAQSPYSVNAIAAMAAAVAVGDQEYIAAYVSEVLAARELLYVGLERLGIPYYPSQANFVLMNVGQRVPTVQRHLHEAGILTRDRSYEIPGGLRVTVGTRDQMRALLAELERVW